MSWWPFRTKTQRQGDVLQRAQIDESMRRITEESDQKVEQAKAKLDEAAERAVKAIDVRYERTDYLREALKTLIDRKTHGRFDMSR
jgi:hypothetical protein